jgi:hypothetical protein
MPGPPADAPGTPGAKIREQVLESGFVPLAVLRDEDLKSTALRVGEVFS